MCSWRPLQKEGVSGTDRERASFRGLFVYSSEYYPPRKLVRAGGTEPESGLAKTRIVVQRETAVRRLC